MRNQLKNMKKRLEELRLREKELSERIEELDKKMHITQNYVDIMDMDKEKNILEAELLSVFEEIDNLNEKLDIWEKSDKEE